MSFAERRKESRERHGDELRTAFKAIDKDNSGWASLDEMCAYMVESKKFNLNKRSLADFQTSMKHYLKNFNYDKTRENELNEKEFVAFWGDLYAIFEKIDKDGDGSIEIVECVELLDEKADKFGLSKNDLYKRVVHFFSQADSDGDRKISLLEFFIQLPKLEEMLMNKKLEQKK